MENNELKQKEDKEKLLEQTIKTALEKQRLQGIRIGLLTASKVVMEKLNDTSKPLAQRIDGVKKWCNVSLADEKKFSK